MIEIEIILILIWLLLISISIVKKTTTNTALLISGFVVGSLFIWLDNTQGQITYTTAIHIPIIHYPIAIICLAAIYFFSITHLSKFVFRKLFKKSFNKYASTAISFLMIAILNLFYPIVDFIIVNMRAGIFTNDHINQFYSSFTYNKDIQQYQFFAYIFFLLAICTNIFLAKGLNKLWNVFADKKGSIESTTKCE